MTEWLASGAACLLRYRYRDGGVQAELPMRVVEDGPDRTVAWLASGTPILYWATPDGGDPRDLPLEQRFARPLGTAPRTWQGPGVLHVMQPGRPYQVVHFRHDDGAFAFWYVNLETPRIRRGAVFEAVDLHLDLLIHADGTPQWKDEDEAAAARDAGALDAADLAASRGAVEELLAGLDRWPGAIGDWRAFRPPDGWTIPPLPPTGAADGSL